MVIIGQHGSTASPCRTLATVHTYAVHTNSEAERVRTAERLDESSEYSMPTKLQKAHCDCGGHSKFGIADQKKKLFELFVFTKCFELILVMYDNYIKSSTSRSQSCD